MEYDFSANENFSVETHHIGRERQPLLLVDNFLRDPDSIVRYAAAENQFIPANTMYPGVVAPVPDAYVNAMVDALVPRIADVFGVKADTVYLMNCFFAIVTFQPEKLHFRQRLPHVDLPYPGQLAILHYLCDSFQGGTGFYRHRATGYESLNEEQNRQYEAHNVQDLARYGPNPAQYINADDRLFEQTAHFEAKFNRLLIYRGNILHSGMIDSKTKLDPNPRVGRLTSNTFLRFDLA